MNNKITGLSTVNEVRSYLKENYHDGVDCACCGQLVKLYRRKLGSAQVQALILLSLINMEKEWCHSREITKEINITGDFAKMLYWGLIEAKPNTRESIKQSKDDNGNIVSEKIIVRDESKKNSGFWKITEKGKDFVNGDITIPSHALIYNAECIGFSGTTTTIQASLGKKFHYGQLMNQRDEEE